MGADRPGHWESHPEQHGRHRDTPQWVDPSANRDPGGR